ncbi:carboxypeptidase family protein [Geothermobacter ehrlichii]|uniref:Carboxypeptidase family protein n=1 Tax=Geothermobacter ehrlichii TaxID=213224 RepID=A0A5D3WIP0_9BACT|nr:carboxypeptidase-like regulatory domain-containing protein [Geothermobacter ehrlichii]TYO96821.1 carboxypeptidase family protein [Geothermobacter ehrlichii]
MFFGGLPFRLLPVLLLLLSACAPTTGGQGVEYRPADWTGTRGRVVDRQGRPAAGAWVYAYRSDRGGLRGPADYAARVAADGRYELDLPAGRFWLVARLRRAGAGDSGPPRRGDAWAPWPRNPLQVRPGRVAVADFVLMPVVQPNILRQGSLVSGDTGFAGRLIDERGRPVAGAFALAYRGRDMHRMPDFTSPPAADDGRFRLFVDGPGVWCLAARQGTRGQPRQGELYGLLAPGEAGCLQVDAGEIREVGDIVLRPFRQSY